MRCSAARAVTPLPATAAVFCSAIATAACGDAPADRGNAARDSAGVRIVENSTPEWSEPLITVEVEPDVTIGSGAGDQTQELFRVTDALRLRDGRLLVLNSGTSEIRFYSASGEHLRMVGGAGSGPGEFRGPRWAVERGDTIIVYDPFQDNGRISYFSSNGDFLSDSRITVAGMQFPSPQAMLPDGTLIMDVSEGSIGWSEPGYVEYTRATIRFPRDGSSVDTIAVTPGGEMFREEFRGGMSQWDVPFGREAYTAFHGERIYLGDGARFVIEAYDLSGAHVFSIRAAHEPVGVDDQLFERWIEVTLSSPFYESNPESRQRMRTRYEQTPYAPTMPAYDRLMTDERGRLWVRQYTPPWEDAGTWSIFDREGRWLGDVALPAGLDVFEIGSGYVLGRRADELDVEYVQLHRLRSRRN